VLAALAAALVGLLAAGTLDPTPGPGGVPAGANAFMVVLSIAFVAGVVAYAAVELAQTGRLESIARQLGTRTLVLMGFAIAINIVLGQIVASGLRLPLYLDSIGTILVGVLAGPIAGAATGLLSNLTWTFVLGGTPIGSPYAWPFAIVAAEIGLVAGLFGYAGVFRHRPNTPLPTLVAGIGVAAAVLGGLAVWGILPFYRDLCGELGPAAAGRGLCFQLFAPATVADPLSQALGVGVLALLALAILGLVVRLVGGRDLGVVLVLVAGALCGVVSALIATPIAALVFGGVTGSGTDLLVALFQQAGADLQTAVLQQSLISDPIDKAIAYVVVFLALGAVSRRLVARFPQGERALGTVET
jgi:energy-coupling factor transport system substrate-specific component